MANMGGCGDVIRVLRPMAAFVERKKMPWCRSDDGKPTTPEPVTRQSIANPWQEYLNLSQDAVEFSVKAGGTAAVTEVSDPSLTRNHYACEPRQGWLKQHWPVAARTLSS